MMLHCLSARHSVQGIRKPIHIPKALEAGSKSLTAALAFARAGSASKYRCLCSTVELVYVGRSLLNWHYKPGGKSSTCRCWYHEPAAYLDYIRLLHSPSMCSVLEKKYVEEVT
jgi:hypothetical protein